jgi:hypothetical protein
VDALLDDPAFFAPYFHPVIGRPSTPIECYLRLMFLKFRYRLGYESLCAEVSGSPRSPHPVRSVAARCRAHASPRASRRLRTSGMPGRDLRLCPRGLRLG